MKPTIKTGLAAILLLAISCMKENNTIQSARITDKSSTPELITDINEPGKYTSVWIHGQQWMTRNLAVASYRNGDRIPQVKDENKWAALTTGAWCWFNNDSATGAIYGRLYNWYAVNDPRGLAPVGWHVPSDAEWDSLETHLGNNAGGKLKETGTTHWALPNTGATNKTGFTGLPGGYRGFLGSWNSGTGYTGFWWSSTEYESYPNSAWYRRLLYNNGYIENWPEDKHTGASVRCLRD